MTRRKRAAYLILPILMLTLAILACSGSYSTTSKINGNAGEVRVKTKTGEGIETTSVELNDDWMRDRVFATVTFTVEAGSCQATLIGEEGTRIEVNASVGSTGQASGDLVTDGFGEVTLDTNCQNAQELDVLISFTLR